MVGTPVFDIDAIREHEAQFAQLGLMERAGAAATQWLLKKDPHFHRVLVVAGPGNNGGDAFVIARLLKEAGKDVLTVALSPPRQTGTPAREAYDALTSAGGELSFDMPSANTHFDWIIDGIFGIGLSRAPREGYASVIERINRMRSARCLVLAIDVPSGVDVLTGNATYPSVVADVTLTFLAQKPGLWTGPALDYLGQLHLLNLDLPTPSAPSEAVVVQWSDVARGLPVRLRTAHKGSAGTVMIVGGADGMIGATLLSARAAIRAGAGKVVASFISEHAPSVDLLFPELMLEQFAAFRSDADAIVIGPGLSTHAKAKEALVRALHLDAPLVLDADALNTIASDFGLRDRLRTRGAETIATPHPGEAARLLNISVDEVNEDRVHAARRLAENLRAHVVLKGAGSVCVSAVGATTICATGNPLLATAGSGDVLAGMMGALLAQRMQPYPAMVLATTWHGHLADRMAARGVVRASASDLIEELKQDGNAS